MTASRSADRLLDADDSWPALFTQTKPWADMDAWHARVGELRRQQPVLPVAVEGFEPFWVLTRHADVFEVSRDSDRWLNTPRSVLAPDAVVEQLAASGMPLPRTLVHLDGIDHRDHRAVTNDWFKPSAVGQRQSRIDDIADLFVERMRDLGGQCDFAQDVAAPFTLRVIMDIYGVPEEDEALMLALTQGVFGAGDPEYLADAADPQARMLSSVMKFIEYFNQMTEDRRRCPKDDLASVIANAEVGGCPIGDFERLSYFVIVATAGHDTTSFGLAGGMEALLRDPAQFKLLQAEPDRIVNATDEIIRWTTPVRHFLRYATEATEIRGMLIPKGGRVLLSYPSANRDEEVFVDSMKFDITRPDADKLLSFGVGAHFCLGAQFARREIRTMMSKLVQHLDHVEPAGPAAWAESDFVSGVKHLPIAYSFR